MKKLFSFLCLLVLGMSMSVTNAMTPDKPSKVKLVQIDNATFKMVMVYNDRNATINSITFSSATSLNGTHSINTTDNCNGDLLYYDMGWNQFSDPQGSVTFVMSGGTSNSDYRYSISMSGTITYSGSCGNNTVDEPFSASWSNVPVEVYESDEATPIDLIDEVEPDYLAIRWDNPSHTKTLTYVDDNNGLSGFEFGSWKLGEKFFKIEGYDPNKANYYKKVRIWFKVTATETYSDGNGGTITGPAPNTYQCKTPGFDGIQQYVYLNDNDNRTANYVVTTSYYGQMSSTLYDKNGTLSTRDFATTDVIYVTKNADGTMYIKCVDKNGDIFCTFGKEPNEFEITVLSEDDNLGTTSGSGIYRKNSNQTISATATAENYEFVQWNDGNTENPRTIQVTENKTYTATFDVIKPKYTITVTSADASKGTVTGGGLYREGANATIIAIPNSGYVFDKWVDGDGNEYDGQALDLIGIEASASFTAYFVLPGMTVGSCDYGADISFHCDYGDILQCKQIKSGYFVYYDYDGYYYDNCRLVEAQNSDLDALHLFFGRNKDSYYQSYSGGECTPALTDAPYEGEYDLLKTNRYNNNKNYWCYPSDATNLVVVWKQVNYYGSNYTNDYSWIKYNGNKIKIRYGAVTVSRNNAGGMFIETNSDVKNHDNESQSIYFTLGNRSEHTVDLGTGTMSVTPSSLTMSAANGSNFASIKLYNNTTGSKTLSDFNIANCSFTYNGNSITEVSDMTGNFTVTNGICTLSLKIRDCKQNLYIVTMSAPAPVYNINYFDKNDAAFSGTQTNAPTTHTFGTATTLNIPTKTGYAFGGWYTASDCGSGAVGNATSASLGATAYTADITLYALWTQKTFTLTATTNPDGLGTVTISPTAPYHYLDEVTLTAPKVTGYTFSGWGGTNSSMMSGDVFTFSADAANNTAYAVTANYNVNKYTLAWDVNDGNELTGTYTSGTIDWGTPITAPADPTKAGYSFGGWDANNDGTADEVAATMPTSDVTYKALWNAVSTDLVLKDGVSTGQTDIDFDAFKATYNGQTMSSVTLNRTFTAGNWATICLPFDVNESQLTNAGLFRKVYEFRYATGSADADSSVTFHFRVATSMEAGRGYLVKGESGLAKKSTFTFEGTESDPIVIDLSADTKTDVNDLKGVNAYYDQSVGSDIAIVGVLRSGTLSNDDRKVMGLANNKIWYPHSSGNPMPAYRAYFYNPDAPDTAPMPRVRIVVEGEGETELEVVDGELYDARGNNAGGDVHAPRKYIRNGVLIIERNGVRYDAQGKRL